MVKIVAAKNNLEITVDKEINPMYVCHIVTSMFGNMIVGIMLLIVLFFIIVQLLIGLSLLRDKILQLIGEYKLP